MKRVILLSLFAFFIGAVGAKAQNLYFCSNYSDNGEPIGLSNSWSLGPNGGYVYLLYNNGKKPIKTKVLIINIARQNGSDYTDFDTKVFDVQDKKNWTIYDYNFKEAGNYRVTVLDNNKNELAKSFVVINLKGGGKEEVVVEDNNNNSKDEEEEEKTETKVYKPVAKDYYNAKMTFCTDIENGKPKNEDESFTIPKAGAYIYIYVMNDRILNTGNITLKVYRQTAGGSYSEEVTNETYTINGEIPGTYIQYSIYKGGEYKVEIYNKDDVFIASGYVGITQTDE